MIIIIVKLEDRMIMIVWLSVDDDDGESEIGIQDDNDDSLIGCWWGMMRAKSEDGGGSGKIFVQAPNADERSHHDDADEGSYLDDIDEGSNGDDADEGSNHYDGNDRWNHDDADEESKQSWWCWLNVEERSNDDGNNDSLATHLP